MEPTYFVTFASDFAANYMAGLNEEQAQKAFDRLCNKEDTLFAAYGIVGEDTANRYVRDGQF